MKKFLLLFISIFLTAQTINAQTVVLDANGVTVKWTGTTVPSPYFVQANPRGTGMEWFAIVNNSTKPYISNYGKNIQSGINYFIPPSSITPIPFNNIVITLVTDMSNMFESAVAFNQPIGSWDVSNVTNMYRMFQGATNFNQPLGNWNVGNVTNMSQMFSSTAFNQPIGSWNVSNVTDMNSMFAIATSFNQPIGSWNVSNVTNMGYMFLRASAFNQPIGNWNVINVTNMFGMFQRASAFNQPIGSWNVGNVTNMSQMFLYATIFNQPISSWNVSGVTNMLAMFNNATSFNQPIGSWNVSNVMDMYVMFYNATAFNQSIGNWNVSNILDMGGMFEGATNFNQPLGNWNVSNVIYMNGMFSGATAFNQPIGSWNVSNVTDMSYMFNGVQLSTPNYDALLIGWSTISPNEAPLKPNVIFSGGNSKYCNGATARNILDFTPNNWTITDGGLDCSSLETETFETNTLKLYPNPVVSLLNIKTDNHLINQPYTIIDGLGRVVLNGKLNEVDTVINVEQLSKGIYYLKIAGNSANKFIKD